MAPCLMVGKNTATFCIKEWNVFFVGGFTTNIFQMQRKQTLLQSAEDNLSTNEFFSATLPHPHALSATTAEAYAAKILCNHPWRWFLLFTVWHWLDYEMVKYLITECSFRLTAECFPEKLRLCKQAWGFQNWKTARRLAIYFYTWMDLSENIYMKGFAT